MVRCQPGFDGGLTQKYVMEVYVQHGQQLAGNVTSDQPSFIVSELRSGLGFDISIYAYNSRGTSDPVQLQAYTLKSAEKRTGTFILYSDYYNNIVLKFILVYISDLCNNQWAVFQQFSERSKKIQIFDPLPP